MLFMKVEFIKIIETLEILLLSIIFIWWTSEAIRKYYDEPVSTIITHTVGDGNGNISFPQITFCGFPLSGQNPVLSKYSKTEYDFFTSIYTYAKEDPTFDLKSLMEGFEMDVFQFLIRVNLTVAGNERFVFNSKDSKLWSVFFHFLFGLCYSFNLSRDSEFSTLSVTENMWQPILNFEFKENLPWSWIAFFIHNENDFPSASLIHPFLWLLNGSYTDFSIVKRTITKVPTRKQPCQKHTFEVCNDIEHYKLIIGKYQCLVPIYYSGHHMDTFFQSGLPICNNSVAKEILSTQFKKSCLLDSVCETTKYSFFKQEYVTNKTNSTNIEISFQDIVVEHFESYISYTIQSVIGEVGGTLGLTLGASAFSIFRIVLDFFQKICHYQSVTKP